MMIESIIFLIRENRVYEAQHLKDRVLVRVSGSEAPPFLQGLITNDMDHLVEDNDRGLLLFTPTKNEETIKSTASDDAGKPIALLRRSMYALFLNTSGRIMFDIIITHLTNECFLIDCNTDSAAKLVKHLKMYRVRRKIDVSIEDSLQVWSVFSKDIRPSDDLTHRIMAEDFLKLNIGADGVISAADPRSKQLGFRVIIENLNSQSAKRLMELNAGTKDRYKLLRYKLGISESPYELITSKALPLESNADYLHGISFHKGCYIGQELTARTHHTGVVRKRIMPLTFSRNHQGLSFETGANLENETTGKSVGKLMGQINNCGMGLMRVEECVEAEKKGENIVISNNKDVIANVFRPTWWPEISPIKLPVK